MDKQILLKPRLSEKSYAISQNGVYVIDVPAGANKHSVARAVEGQFDVKVSRVNIVNNKGKAKRVMSLLGKNYRNVQGRQTNVKKAYVTLAKGSSLPFFEAVEEAEEKQQQTQEKITKAMEKQADKETKSSRRGLHLPGRRGARGGDK